MIKVCCRRRITFGLKSRAGAFASSWAGLTHANPALASWKPGLIHRCLKCFFTWNFVTLYSSWKDRAYGELIGRGVAGVWEGE
jgi:hypothetical protein